MKSILGFAHVIEEAGSSRTRVARQPVCTDLGEAMTTAQQVLTRRRKKHNLKTDTTKFVLEASETNDESETTVFQFRYTGDSAISVPELNHLRIVRLRLRVGEKSLREARTVCETECPNPGCPRGQSTASTETKTDTVSSASSGQKTATVVNRGTHVVAPAAPSIPVKPASPPQMSDEAALAEAQRIVNSHAAAASSANTQAESAPTWQFSPRGTLADTEASDIRGSELRSMLESVRGVYLSNLKANYTQQHQQQSNAGNKFQMRIDENSPTNEKRVMVSIVFNGKIQWFPVGEFKKVQ